MANVLDIIIYILDIVKYVLDIITLYKKYYYPNNKFFQIYNLSNINIKTNFSFYYFLIISYVFY